jgi:arylsulfatase A-like enzyme
LVVTLVAAALVQAVAAQPPNILVIVTDDQRATGTLDVMPNTRAFFRAGGVRYPNAFATTPLCCPARSTILSGRYAHNTGVKSNAPPLALDMTTIFPRLLHDAGYQTALVGKFLNSWPLGDAPPYFDEWALGGNPYFNSVFDINGSVVRLAGYTTALTGDFAVSFLRGFETNDDAPWFLYVAPVAPHLPSRPEKRYRHAPLPAWHGNPAVFERNRSDKPPYVRSVYYDEADGAKVRRKQLRALMSVDDMVGRIVARLNQLHENRATLAFFLSDNGYLWAEHHLGGDSGRDTGGQKRVPYTPSVRIPFLVRWPGHLPEGVADTRLTGTVDIAPTALAAAEVDPDPAKPPLDGRSLFDANARSRLVLEYWQTQKSSWIPTWASILTKDFQFIENYADDGTTPTSREYYDLHADPWQLGNIMRDGNPTNNPDVAALSAQLAQDRVCQGTGPGPTPCP